MINALENIRLVSNCICMLFVLSGLSTIITKNNVMYHLDRLSSLLALDSEVFWFHYKVLASQMTFRVIFNFEIK